MIQTQTNWVKEMLDEGAVRDELKAFLSTVPCGELGCHLELTQVWDIDGILMIHNGIWKIINSQMASNSAYTMRQGLIDWLRQQHMDLGDGAVRFVECN